MSYSEALRIGAKRYDGQPCRHGHGTLRYVSSRRCVVCDHQDAVRRAKGAVPAISRRQRRDDRKAAILAALSEGPCDVQDLQERTRIPSVSLYRLLEVLRAAEAVHIKRRLRTRGQPRLVFAIGQGKDAPKLKAMTSAQRAERQRKDREKDELRQWEYDVAQQRAHARKKQGKPHRDPLVAALFGPAGKTESPKRDALTAALFGPASDAA